MLYVFIELYLFGQVKHRAVDFHSRVTAFPIAFELFGIFALSAADHGRVNEYFRSFAHRHNFFGNGIDRGFFDNPAAFRTMRNTSSRI